jgi:hypothetical protein
MMQVSYGISSHQISLLILAVNVVGISPIGQYFSVSGAFILKNIAQ